MFCAANLLAMANTTKLNKKTMMPTSMTNYAISRTCRRLGQRVFFQAGAGVKTPARSPGINAPVEVVT